MVIFNHILASTSGFGKNFMRPIDGIGLDIFLKKNWGRNTALSVK